MKRNQLFALSFLILSVWSCRNDDDGLLDAEIVPPQTVAETEVENDDAIIAYLETHFYNYEEFETPPEGFDFKIKIDTLTDDDSDTLPLINFVQTSTFQVLESDSEAEISHTLYYLIARDGIGDSPTIGDNAFVRYEGSLLDGTTFDASSTPTPFNLSGVVRGFGNAVTKLRGGEGPIENGDGTVSYDGYGIGMVIMPSGLGYFNAPPNTIIPSYSPLIFKFDLLSFLPDTDFDGDGIPSILEDIDGDGNLNNDNTDEDTEPSTIYLANYNDTDDDADGILTIEEIELDADGNFVGFIDTDGDGIFDHLDNDN